MEVGLLTNRINNKLEKSNLINEHMLNHEPVPLNVSWKLSLLISKPPFLLEVVYLPQPF